MRIAIYHIYSAWRCLACFPSWFLFIVTNSIRQKWTTASWTIYCQPQYAANADLVECVVKALELVKTIDPINAGRVSTEIRNLLILELPGNTAARYQRLGRVCQLNARIPSVIEQNATLAMAGFIVHEAVHGRLATLRFPHLGRALIERHEAICRRVVRRFLARASKKSHDITI
jgi:hypothetical protein